MLIDSLPDSVPTVDDLDVILCPPGLRSDALRAVGLASNEVLHALTCLERRARELRLPIFQRRVDGIRMQLAEAAADLARVPR